uniref:Uncharacterized protein n=1 Tax=Daphnia magna TaxID=35525 RepID=A0A0P5A1L6_9CRUS
MSFSLAQFSSCVGHRFQEKAMPHQVLKVAKRDFHGGGTEGHREKWINFKQSKAYSRGRGRSIGFSLERERRERMRMKSRRGRENWRQVLVEKRGEERTRAVHLERLRGMKTLGFEFAFEIQFPFAHRTRRCGPSCNFLAQTEAKSF